MFGITWWIIRKLIFVVGGLTILFSIWLAGYFK